MPRAFLNCTASSITIPDTVTSIGSNAISSCYNLTSFTIPNSVKVISRNAFTNDRFASITIPNGVVSIGPGAFAWCTYLTSINIPESVEEIDPSAFEHCYSLSSYAVSEDNQYYSAYGGALYNKDKTEIILCPYNIYGTFTLPDSLQSVNDEAFAFCDGISAFEINADSQYFSTEDGILYNKNKTKLIRCPAAKEGDIVVPYSVNEYAPKAFRVCRFITSLVIPYGPTELWSNAFYGCNSLASITLPDSLERICGGAFSDCTSLTTIDLPANISYLENNAFYNSGFETIYLPANVEHIDVLAFQSTFKLEAVYIDDNNPYYHTVDGVLYDADMTKILYCPGAKAGDFAIPNGVEKMGGYAFYSAGSITSISFPLTFNGEIPSGAFVNCKSIESFSVDTKNSTYSSANGCLLSKDGTNLIAAPNAITGTFVVPEGVTMIYSFAFAFTSANFIVLPTTLTTLNNSMFYCNYNLTGILILSTHFNLTQEGTVDLYCDNLVAVYLANTSIEQISYQAFKGVFSADVCVYFYSDENPHSPNMYWHYVDGVPTIWP